MKKFITTAIILSTILVSCNNKNELDSKKLKLERDIAILEKMEVQYRDSILCIGSSNYDSKSIVKIHGKITKLVKMHEACGYGIVTRSKELDSLNKIQIN